MPRKNTENSHQPNASQRERKRQFLWRRKEHRNCLIKLTGMSRHSRCRVIRDVASSESQRWQGLRAAARWVLHPAGQRCRAGRQRAAAGNRSWSGTNIRGGGNGCCKGVFKSFVHDCEGTARVGFSGREAGADAMCRDAGADTGGNGASGANPRSRIRKPGRCVQGHRPGGRIEACLSLIPPLSGRIQLRLTA